MPGAEPSQSIGCVRAPEATKTNPSETRRCSDANYKTETKRKDLEAILPLKIVSMLKQRA